MPDLLFLVPFSSSHERFAIQGEERQGDYFTGVSLSSPTKLSSPPRPGAELRKVRGITAADARMRFCPLSLAPKRHPYQVDMSTHLEYLQQINHLCKVEELQATLADVAELVTVRGRPVESFGRLRTTVLQLADDHPDRLDAILAQLHELLSKLTAAQVDNVGSGELARSCGQQLRHAIKALSDDGESAPVVVRPRRNGAPRQSHLEDKLETLCSLYPEGASATAAAFCEQAREAAGGITWIPGANAKGYRREDRLALAAVHKLLESMAKVRHELDAGRIARKVCVERLDQLLSTSGYEILAKIRAAKATRDNSEESAGSHTVDDGRGMFTLGQADLTARKREIYRSGGQRREWYYS
ncbi:hypothetical protein BMF94_5376 [Rhodotorula taiwanensis]|uniref:Uncharacterized protein n=1 Tax=Rhodotorula taiwanensis TaxID=741276 RepID=A0A2S5B4F3_9BASI|nr:hypothetical protein BMF94_5376 [Rhodotorula taiwanensis]